jgi:DHA1 family bicyclomycin/chloramphenicol resistance-like MFS transporter
VAAAANLAYAALLPVALPWAIVAPMIYSFGMALASPAMTVRALELFPRHRGVAASMQTFLFMALFAAGSGIICPLLFGSAWKLAAAVAAGVTLSALCWRAGLSVPPASTDGELVEEDTVAT